MQLFQGFEAVSINATAFPFKQIRVWPKNSTEARVMSEFPRIPSSPPGRPIRPLLPPERIKRKKRRPEADGEEPEEETEQPDSAGADAARDPDTEPSSKSTRIDLRV